MKGRRYRKRVTRTLLTSLLGVAACSVVAMRPAFPGEATGSGTSVAQPPAEKPVPEGAAGMKIYIDPQTGAIRPDPAPGTAPLELTPQLRDAFSTSHQGLSEVQSSVPGGGFKLDLQGRFQSPLVVTIDADGKVKMQHPGQPPEARGETSDKTSGDKK
jgi:hypothetical protein